ncbi:unnamed protein product [Gongylonema pulchrum]|uniref:40S ribosomal protein S3a n=1 Tax=Gongylonema pulchrum TaxID=637853 RepID=A0A183E3X0_9BILA|nr:unnamed protein product [Gongylonema pulchrum]
MYYFPEIASEGLKGRVYEVSLGDLNNAESEFRKMRLICEDVQGRTCLTNFHGMRLTRDKLCSIVKKWHTLIEANVAVKTSDGYLLRLFCIGFTKKNAGQLKKTSYAKSSKIRQIRAKMIEYMQKEVRLYISVLKHLFCGVLFKQRFTMHSCWSLYGR